MEAKNRASTWLQIDPKKLHGHYSRQRQARFADRLCTETLRWAGKPGFALWCVGDSASIGGS
jgi:hypothetical protein